VLVRGDHCRETRGTAMMKALTRAGDRLIIATTHRPSR
jgi:hypothetical protein